MADENKAADGAEDQQAVDQNTGDAAKGDEKAADAADKGKKDAAGDDFSLLDDENPDTKDFDASKKPDYLSEDQWKNLYDAEEGKFKDGAAETLAEEAAKQAKMAKDLRAKLSQKGSGKAPAKPEDYKLELSDEAKAVIPEGDPLMEELPKFAHEAGLSNEAYNTFVEKVVGWLGSNSPEERLEAMTEEQKAQYRDAVYKEIGANAPQIVRSVTEFGRQLKESGVMSEDMMQEFKALGATAAGIKLLNMWRTDRGGEPLAANTVLQDGLPTDAEIARLLQKAQAEGDEEAHNKAMGLIEKRNAAGRPVMLQA